MRSIAVANQKGGVGKTTTSVNLAVALARAGQDVCLVDLDPQAHATLHAGVQPGLHPLSAYDVLVGGASLAEARVTAAERLHVIPSHIDLSAVEMALANRPGREGILRQRIEADDACQGKGAGVRHAGCFHQYIVELVPFFHDALERGDELVSNRTADTAVIHLEALLEYLTAHAYAFHDKSYQTFVLEYYSIDMNFEALPILELHMLC